MSQLTERFGTLVFSDHVRKQYLPSDISKTANLSISMWRMRLRTR